MEAKNGSSPGKTKAIEVIFNDYASTVYPNMVLHPKQMSAIKDAFYAGFHVALVSAEKASESLQEDTAVKVIRMLFQECLEYAESVRKRN